MEEYLEVVALHQGLFTDLSLVLFAHFLHHFDFRSFARATERIRKMAPTALTLVQHQLAQAATSSKFMHQSRSLFGGSDMWPVQLSHLRAIHA